MAKQFYSIIEGTKLVKQMNNRGKEKGHHRREIGIPQRVSLNLTIPENITSLIEARNYTLDVIDEWNDTHKEYINLDLEGIYSYNRPKVHMQKKMHRHFKYHDHESYNDKYLRTLSH